MHWPRNFDRSLPWSPFASACAEQAFEMADCAGVIAFGVTVFCLAMAPVDFVVAIGATGVVGGVAVCAIALVPTSAKMAVAVKVAINRIVVSFELL
jgi:hypothetical protein